MAITNDNNSPHVSVVVPVYNTAKYLNECLDSIINQTFRNIEVIVVNDGSTDNSAEIASQYVRSDERVALINKANGYVGSARNAGLKAAQGKYVMFIDSDDYILPDTINTVYNAMQSVDCDTLLYNGTSFEDYDVEKKFDTRNYFDLNKTNENTIYTGLELLKITGGRVQQPGMKIFTRSYLTDNNIYFLEGKFGEDVSFFYESTIKASRITYLNYVGYCRRFRPHSQVTQTSINNIRDRIITFDSVSDLLNLIHDKKYHAIIAGQFAYYAILLWVLTLNRSKAEDRAILLDCFSKQDLPNFIKRHRGNNYQLHILYRFIMLPQSIYSLNIILAGWIRTIFKSKSKLLSV